MAVKIAIPDVKLQHAKTAALRRIKLEIENPETGRIEQTLRWVKITEDTGENVRVVNWKELFRKIKDYLENRTLEECKQLYEYLTGEPYEGVNSKKGMILAYIKLRFNVDLSNLTTTEIIQKLGDELMPKLGHWGLGCPHGCGRHWEFKPTEDLTSFEPADPAAMKGVDEEGNPTRGYLNWQPQPDGTIRFVCDRCGNIVELIK